MVLGKQTKLLLALKMPNVWQVPQKILMTHHSWLNPENVPCKYFLEPVWLLLWEKTLSPYITFT